MRKLIAISLIVFLTNSFAQLNVEKVEPANWWQGMKLNKIQLMVYGENLTDIKASFNTKNIKITKIHNLKNSNYSFIDIDISKNCKPDNYELTISNKEGEQKVVFPILERAAKNNRYQGFSKYDAVYLIMPDRFANGDVTNDTIEGMRNDFNPNDQSKRHGGDLQGIINKLDYLKNLGFTAIWINPILENNTFHMSYHGYAASNLYKIDPRFGTNELYKKLVEEAHNKGIKIIFDHIANHIGVDHRWMQSLPTEDWLNGTPEKYFITNHNKIAYADNYKAPSTEEKSLNGWFVEQMPDLNQRNPFVANYLTQNMIWWIEYTGLDGIREDTYPYPDQKFMSDWGKAILEEYPNFNIVGEAWINDPVFVSYYQHKSPLRKDKYDSYLPSVMDFPLMFGLQDFLIGTKGLNNIYEIFAKDIVYNNPDNLMTFIDNHDHQRGLFAGKGNIKKMKAALTMLLTTRGIPQILYGTEIAMEGGESHPELRLDFPGGFPNSTRNAFVQEERNKQENEVFNHIQKLLRIRKNYPVVVEGKFIQFPTENEIYFYIKEDLNRKMLFVINGKNENREVKISEIYHRLSSGTKLRDLLSDKTYDLNKDTKIELDEWESAVFVVE